MALGPAAGVRIPDLAKYPVVRNKSIRAPGRIATLVHADF